MNSRQVESSSTFASGLNGPVGLAIDGVGDVFEADNHGYDINEFSPSGVESTFNSSLPDPLYLAFEPEPVPEPSVLVLIVIGVTGLVIRHRKQWGNAHRLKDLRWSRPETRS